MTTFPEYKHTPCQLNTYGEISKYDEQADGSLIVEGIASTDSVDRQGEVVSSEAMRAAIPLFMADPALREMHQPIAAGVPLEMRVQEDGRTFAKVHVVDKGSVAKIKAGVLRGFSIGGATITKVGNNITKLLLRELSLVDRSCNPECKFTLAKVDTTNFMEETLKADIATLKETVATLATAVKTLADKPAPQPITSLFAKVDDKDVAITGEMIHGLLTKFDGLTNELALSKAAVITGERASIIAKMDNEGRAPIDPATGVAYKSEDLAKLDLPLLKVLAANSPVVPLSSRAALLKIDAAGKPIIDNSVTGEQRLEKSWSNVPRN